MNNWTIAGNIGKDAVLRVTGSGKSVLGFAVAVEERHGGEKSTMWVDCSLWGERGEKLAEYLLKGTKVCVSGQAGTREHNGKAYATLNVREVTLLGGGREQSGGTSRGSGRPARQATSAKPSAEMEEDSIPFVSNRGIW